MKAIFKADSIVQRDALQARLAAARISSESPDRDMSRKIIDSTVDLSLEGYSALFDGFDIYVEEADTAAADRVVREFLSDVQSANLADQRPVPHWQRFYFCSIFSFLFPILMPVLATYHLVKALRSGVPPSEGRGMHIAGGLMFGLGWALTITLAIVLF